MRGRTVGKVITTFLAVLFALLSFNYIHKGGGQELAYQGLRAIAYAILALTAATFYRYFED